MKTKDIDLRLLVTRALLDHGVPREAIRHEITLETSSSDGRADMVVALDDTLTGIEIKSGKDTLERLDSQRERYGRRFDRLCLVLDARHLPKDEMIRKEHPGGGYSECSAVGHFINDLRFGSVAIARNGKLEQAWGYRLTDLPWDPECYTRRCGGPTTNQAPMAMLSMLWASEVVTIAARLVSDGKVPPAGAGGQRCRLIPHLAEHAPIALLRPAIAQALRARKLNRWEEAFWRDFDRAAAPAEHLEVANG